MKKLGKILLKLVVINMLINLIGMIIMKAIPKEKKKAMVDKCMEVFNKYVEIDRGGTCCDDGCCCGDDCDCGDDCTCDDEDVDCGCGCRCGEDVEA